MSFYFLLLLLLLVVLILNEKAILPSKILIVWLNFLLPSSVGKSKGGNKFRFNCGVGRWGPHVWPDEDDFTGAGQRRG